MAGRQGDKGRDQQRHSKNVAGHSENAALLGGLRKLVHHLALLSLREALFLRDWCGAEIVNTLQHLQFTLSQPEHHIGLFCQFVGVGDNHHAFPHSVGALFENIRDVLGSVSSRLPVGSSARITGASLARARAIAPAAAGRRRASAHCAWLLLSSAPGAPEWAAAAAWKSATHSLRGQIVNQVIRLENKRHMVFPVVGKPRLGNILPIKVDLAAAGAVQAAD